MTAPIPIEASAERLTRATAELVKEHERALDTLRKIAEVLKGLERREPCSRLEEQLTLSLVRAAVEQWCGGKS